MDDATSNALDAAVLRRLIAHLDARRDVQNIELMILAGFCRNCLSQWYHGAAREQGVGVDLDAAQRHVYGMSYADWKKSFQPPATAEQLERLEAVSRNKA